MGQRLLLTALVHLFLLYAVASQDNFYSKDRMRRIPGRMDDLEQNVTHYAGLLEDQTKTLNEHIQLAKDQCLKTEKNLLRNLHDQSLVLDPLSLRLEIVEAVQDSALTGIDSEASNAIDGNTDSNYNHDSCAHTAKISAQHLWQGKLLFNALVTRVTIFNRGDCCRERLSNYRIEGFKEDPRTNTDQVAYLCSNHPSAVPTGEGKTIDCDAPTPSRYIRITQNENMIALALCEVKVDGAMAKTALQSSSYLTIQHGAWRALDKDPETCTHTNFETDSDTWWQVDLGQMETVTGITITNRNDHKYSWLKQFEVVVYESQPTDCVGVEVSSETCAIHASGVSKGQTVTLTCDTPVTGQFVRITKTNIPREALSLCEVVVEIQK